ncbi:MAG: alanine--tRNA ligase [Candidatus Zambryskibacteria bacterium]
MTSAEIREKFLKFFEEKGHKRIPSASLIPENDPSVLFTTAGMHPLVPYLLGEKHPLGNKLADVQKCIRTGDIDEVGDSFHHTFFEMLGNWSLGDYWKEDAIKFTFEFHTKVLGIPVERYAVSVFEGDSDAPFDNESFEIWKSLEIPEERIARLPKKNNWWGPAGETGPCGPDTEMFYWTEEGDAPTKFDPDDNRWVEIGNDVLMQYVKDEKGNYNPANQKNVDFGGGLERTLSVINGLDDNYRTELFWPIIEKIENLSGKKYEDRKKEFRIIADHIKAAVFILSEGIEPSNTKHGYVLRRLIRRAVYYMNRNMKDMGFDSKKFGLIAEVVMKIYEDTYSEFKNEEKCKDILDKLSHEIRKFRMTIENGLKEFEKGTDPFVLFTSYGFPFELTKELAKEKGIEIDENKFNEELKKHQELSRTASAGMFKGGLSDGGEENKKLHTATHLLLAALRKVLGEDIVQKGSNITTERLRFDFNWPKKLTPEQIKAVEDLVNQKIAEKIPVEMMELPKEEAIKVVGTLSFDLSKYGDVVKVYKIGDFSTEFCGGPHVSNTSELGHFKIIKEEASSQGIRRIKAVLE